MAVLGSVECPVCGGQASIRLVGEHLDVADDGRRVLAVTVDVDCACAHQDPVEVTADVDPAPKRTRKPAKKSAAKKTAAKPVKKSTAKPSGKGVKKK